MLFLYQSHQLESLAALWLQHIKVHPLASPFVAEKVLVQSKGMGRWLNFKLATEQGIAAHVDYIQPASFFWQLLNQVLGVQDAQSPFAKDILVWRIDAWLADNAQTQAIPVLQSYLAGGDAYRRYALADKLASLFDQYLVYRPDWVNAWAQGQLLNLGEHEHWQAALWQDLVAQLGPQHRARALEALQNKLKQPTSQVANLGLPQRISVFGISSLPPVYMEILRTLAEHSHVCVFALNPCMVPWGDIRDHREIDRISQKNKKDPHDLYLELGHPLLAKWGKQGRAFLDEFASADETDSIFLTESELKQPIKTVLQALQHSVLTLSYPLPSHPNDSDSAQKEGDAYFKVRASDDSIQVHCCHSPMREVEVLHDQILQMLAKDPNLQPADIVALTPDIEQYTSFIHAVFKAQDGEIRIPYAVADRKVQHSLPLLKTVLQLLHLPESRFTVAEVFAWLDAPAIAQRFKLTAYHIEQLKEWVRSAGIRWGRDAAHLQALGLPSYPYNTWREGLDRLVMGLTMPHTLAPNGIPLWDGLVPTEAVEGSNSAILAQFYAFIEVLFSYAQGLAQDRTMLEWLEYYQQLLADIADPQTDEDIQAVQFLRNQLQALQNQTHIADYTRLIPLSVFRSSLQQGLDNTGGSSGFLTGGVTFCTLLPMRSLPFKVICVLGLNDGAIPRNAKNDGFDLMLTHPQTGDRSRRGDDRYLFLETILSARQALYLSYVGRGVRDNAEYPPSILLADLLDALTGLAICEQDEQAVAQHQGVEALRWQTRARDNLLAHLCQQHPLQPFNPRYFTQDSRLISYQSMWLKSAQQLQQGLAAPMQNLPNAGQAPALINTAHTCTLDDFYRYFNHASRSFLRGVVGLDFPYVVDEIPDEEPMDVKNFEDARSMRNQLLGLFAHDKLGCAAHLLSAQGLLPHGNLGLHYTQTLTDSAQHLYQTRQSYGDYLPACSVSVDLQHPNLTLHDTLTELTDTGLCLLEVGNLYHHTLLNAWLKHLLMCAAAPKPQATVLIGLNATCEWPAMEAHTAKAWLERYTGIWQQGQHQPIPLFRKSGMVFAESLWAGLKEKLHINDCLEIGSDELQTLDMIVWHKALGEACKKWSPHYTGDFQSAEADDTYIKALWGQHTPWEGDNPVAASPALIFLPIYAYLRTLSGALK